MVELVRSSCETWEPHGFPVRAAQPWKPLREAGHSSAAVSRRFLTSDLLYVCSGSWSGLGRIHAEYIQSSVLNCAHYTSKNGLTVWEWKFKFPPLFHNSRSFFHSGGEEWSESEELSAWLSFHVSPTVWAVQGSLQGCCWRTLEPQIVLFCFIDFCLLVFFTLVHFSGFRAGQSKWTPWFQIRPFQSFK